MEDKFNINDICQTNLNYINELKENCIKKKLDVNEVYNYYKNVIEENKKIYEERLGALIELIPTNMGMYGKIIHSLHIVAKNKVEEKYNI